MLWHGPEETSLQNWFPNSPCLGAVAGRTAMTAAAAPGSMTSFMCWQRTAAFWDTYADFQITYSSWEVWKLSVWRKTRMLLPWNQHVVKSHPSTSGMGRKFLTVLQHSQISTLDLRWFSSAASKELWISFKHRHDMPEHISGLWPIWTHSIPEP